MASLESCHGASACEWGPIPLTDSSDSEQIQQMAEQVFELMVLSWISPETGNEEAKWDLSEPEILTLELLTKCERMSVGDIQRAIGVATTKMSRIIRRLERETDEPLVECKLNPEERRKIDVSITEVGRQAHRAYRATKMAGIMEVLAEMPESDRAEFMRLLGTIRERLLQAYLSKHT